jgi:hypothetical protein
MRKAIGKTPEKSPGIKTVNLKIVASVAFKHAYLPAI